MIRTIGMFAFGLAACLAASGQDRPQPAVDRALVYSAKFVCKNVTPPDDPSEAIRSFLPGVYRTVLNFQNLSRDPATVRMIVTEATGVESPSTGSAGRIERVLAPGEANFLNCSAIQRILGGDAANPRKVDGFVTLESNRRLAAAAVYSAVTRSPQIANDGITLDVEHLRARIRRLDGTVDAE